MANGVVIKSLVMAQNVDSLNRVAISADSTPIDVQNGSVGYLDGKSTTAGEGEVWNFKAPVTASLSNLWMAASPEDVLTDGKYKGLDPDPRNFINVKGKTFDVFQPKVGDIITLTADAVEGSANTYVVATNTKPKLQWAAAAVSGLSLKLIATKTISIGIGSLGSTQRVTAYEFEVVAVA